MPSSLLGRISLDLLLPEDRLDYLIQSAPYRYKVYSIPKRSGTGGRIIAQPAKEIKRIQYWVIEHIFESFSIHPAATAYIDGKNIRLNAYPHAGSPYFLKLDFKNFFPSIKGRHFLQYAHENDGFGFEESDLERLVRILFWCPKSQKQLPKSQQQLQLSIGAPSSPFLSNAMMYQFDNEIANFCAQFDVTYTRYADDMTFSMHDKTMRGTTLSKVFEILHKLPFPRLQINDTKTIFGSKAHRRMITGLILSNEGTVSLGHNRKRLLRAEIHHFITGKLSNPERIKLRGMLAFARDVEPEFVERMENRYGVKHIKSI